MFGGSEAPQEDLKILQNRRSEIEDLRSKIEVPYLRMTERAQTACCHASVVVFQSEAPEQSEDRGVVRGDGISARRI